MNDPYKNKPLEILKRALFFFIIISILSQVTTAPPQKKFETTSNLKSHIQKQFAYDKALTTKEEKITLLNINEADHLELTNLPGIGDVIANRIIEYRNQYPFKKKEELLAVKGIGAKRYSKISSYIYVSSP